MNEKALRVRYQKNKVKKERWKMYDVIIIGAGAVSYTHLTLPTIA